MRTRGAAYNATGRYLTWAHAVYVQGYRGTSRPLCGKRAGDWMLKAEGPEAWDEVSCRSCRRIIDKLEREAVA